MLKMIIADDERKIRESIRNVIDWEKLGIYLVGLCKNGLEAYDMILDESPDIALVDIKMPALSGLELISRIVHSGQSIEFIILSGYGEFVYTREAMRYGIKHYLLKPCNEEELIGVVKEVADVCYKRKAQQIIQQSNVKIPQIDMSSTNGTGKDCVDQTMQFVQNNLSNPELSLKLIAETRLFMNVDYLSKQFFKYAGCKFSTFLAEMRIEEARKLLVSNRDISIQEVAAAVGCGNNPQYFSVLFKKHTGVTATDYIKKHSL